MPDMLKIIQAEVQQWQEALGAKACGGTKGGKGKGRGSGTGRRQQQPKAGSQLPQLASASAANLKRLFEKSQVGEHGEGPLAKVPKAVEQTEGAATSPAAQQSSSSIGPAAAVQADTVVTVQAVSPAQGGGSLQFPSSLKHCPAGQANE